MTTGSSSSGDPIRDHRARMELARLEARERREHALNDMRSPVNDAGTRVAIWERLHQVRLPVDATHPVLLLIAQQVGLQLAEVLEVQRQRAPLPTT